MPLNVVGDYGMELAAAAEGGVRVDQLPKGTRLVLQTVNRDYLVEIRGGLHALLQGHPDYCPEPIAVYVVGSRRPGCAPEPGCIQCGMRVEFWSPTTGFIETSTVQRLRILPGYERRSPEPPGP